MVGLIKDNKIKILRGLVIIVYNTIESVLDYKLLAKLIIGFKYFQNYTSYIKLQNVREKS